MPRTLSTARATFLQDVLVAAVEGGTGYWAQVSGYRWSDDNPETGQATFHVLDDDGIASGDRHLVNLETIATGISRIVQNDVQVRADLRAVIAEASRENDGGLVDADAADVIVQAALFGQVVYG